MSLSKVGYVRFIVYGLLLLVNTVVLALSGHINHFQAFFYKADIFPLALSLVTLVFVFTMVFVDINVKNAFTARPPFELGWLLVLSTLWLGFNAFSTSRWKFASMGLCSTIPSDAQYAPYRTWCHELQALRVFVWIEWVMLLCTFAYLFRWTLSKHKSGRRDVWSTAISRFPEHPSARSQGHTNSEFLQWEKFPQSFQQPSTESQDHYIQSPQAQQNHFSREQYSQYLEAPYIQTQYVEPIGGQPIQPQYAQYTPPSRTQYARSPQLYLSESPQAL